MNFGPSFQFNTYESFCEPSQLGLATWAKRHHKLHKSYEKKLVGDIWENSHPLGRGTTHQGEVGPLETRLAYMEKHIHYDFNRVCPLAQVWVVLP